MEEELKKIIEKKVFICLKTNRHYSGVVKKVSDNIIQIIDKFGEVVFININNISSMEVEPNHGRKWNRIKIKKRDCRVD